MPSRLASGVNQNCIRNNTPVPRHCKPTTQHNRAASQDANMPLIHPAVTCVQVCRCCVHADRPQPQTPCTCISTMKDEALASMESPVPMRVSSSCTGASSMCSAGTYAPHCAITTSSPTCFRYVLLPACSISTRVAAGPITGCAGYARWQENGQGWVPISYQTSMGQGHLVVCGTRPNNHEIHVMASASTMLGPVMMCRQEVWASREVSLGWGGLSGDAAASSRGCRPWVQQCTPGCEVQPGM